MTHASPDIPPTHKRIIERIIALTLQIGVVSSIVLVFIGAVITFMHHPDYVSDPGTLPRLIDPDNRTGVSGSSGNGTISATSDFPKTLPQLISGLAAFRGQAIIVLGLFVLLATPILRVAISTFIFLIENDTRFVCITLFVLALLLLSFFLGKAES